jgi:hypothetical protein
MDLRVGPGETELVLSALAANEFPDVSAARLGLKTMLSGDRLQWSRFDELFDAYWLKRGLRLAERAPAKAAFPFGRKRPNRSQEGSTVQTPFPPKAGLIMMGDQRGNHG